MSPRTGTAFRVAWLLLAAWVLVVVVFPLLSSAVEITAGLLRSRDAAVAGDSGASWRALVSGRIIASTLFWSLGVGVGSALLAVPAAWALRRRGAALVPWLLVPLAMPSYLAYSGYGLVRAPGTLLGDWLGRAAHGPWPGAPFIAGQVLAFFGLCLWSWPVPALFMGWSASMIDDSVLDALELDRPGRIRRWAFLVAILRRPIVAGVLLVALIMLGSAIPLHLAQVPTWSMKLWFALDNVPASERWRVWVLASPLVVLAAVAAWKLAALAAKPAWTTPDVSSTARRGRSWVLVPAAGTVVPLVLFANSIREASSLTEFWRVNRDAAGWTGLVAAHVALMAAFLCGSTWFLCSGTRSHRSARWTIVLLTAAGLLPGVVLGAAINQAWMKWEQTRAVADSYWVVVLAHSARFGWIPAWIGCLLAAAEPYERRQQRLLDGATGLRGWWSAAARPGASILAGASVLTGLLSVHEIESTVMVQPPGIDGLARRMLQFLHFSRMEDLSAASVWLIGGGLAAASLTAWALRGRAVSPLADRATPG